MPRLLAVLSVLALLPAMASAKKHDRYQIHDFSSERYAPLVAASVDDFNAIMPPRGPDLIYIREAGGCDTRKDLTICMSEERDYAGLTAYRNGHPWRIYLSVGSGPSKEIVCHELMHALADAPDRYGAAPETSCVWGSLASPGATDISLLKKRYTSR